MNDFDLTKPLFLIMAIGVLIMVVVCWVVALV